MADVSTQYLTMLELSKRLGPDLASLAPVVETIGIQHGLMRRLRWQQGNLPTGHQCSVRTGLPAVYWRLFNRGTPPSSSQVAQLTFAAAKLESFAEVDEEIFKLAPDGAALRRDEAAGHLESMAQEFSSTAYYGTAASPEEFVGLSTIYSDPTAANGQNVLDAGGTDGSDNTSIWLVNSGPNFFGIYPRGTTAGVSANDMGVQLIENFGGTGRRARALVEHFMLGCGLVVQDWRDIVRIGSIDVSALVAQSNDANLTYWTRKAKGRLRGRNIAMGQRFWLMNRTTHEYLMHQRDDRTLVGGGITRETIDGIETDMLHGYPIEIDDNILNTEAPV